MIGTDIIEIERVRKAVQKHKKHFLDRIFSAKEQQDCAENMERLAGRFAAKEAIAKALGTGFGEKLSWLDIEISNDDTGRPIATLSTPHFPNTEVHISISHCKTYATAVALLN